jgi:hypothetical protein
MVSLSMVWTTIGNDDPLATILIPSSELTTKHGRFNLAATCAEGNNGSLPSKPASCWKF